MDEHLGEGQVRIEVEKLANLKEVKGQYIQYSASEWRRVVNYIADRGIVATFKKVLSRWRERHRNQKWLSVGLGKIIESRSHKWPEVGEGVAFLAYDHPQCFNRVVVDEEFLVAWETIGTGSEVKFVEPNHSIPLPDEIERYAGWAPESEWSVDETSLQSAIEQVAGKISHEQVTRRLLVDTRKSIKERAEKDTASDSLTACLFGLGNYAKTTILPNVPDEIRVDCIHEIDPVQVGKPDAWDCTIDTSGTPSDKDRQDIFFVAGYHHTHTPIAVQALQRGGWAVVEKPLCTTFDQYKKIKTEVEVRPRLFAGFHKRYSKLNDWAREDLEVQPGKPINYHCVVFEVPLPSLHWYNWPSVGSRIVSNGCHWLDHFMFLNEYVPVRSHTINESSTKDIVVTVELENDAFFTMTLTDAGSDRLGVREHVELRAGDVTVTISDGSKYKAENSKKLLRKRSENKRSSYYRMYQSICEKILEEKDGDNVNSLRSTKLMLELEKKI
ncbi:putative dehydrogenase [Salinibacter ruber]|uniref:Gfo/Idh/MocA family oxidoreductase n=1 Tax=Salinibacter ruber TaxID=146919 RepID=UPI0021696C67|nr:Gfo/Idh/MocA family oxidoreductase [Salinibacter ruber]MCS3831104.1 putative dehydrogenase [Salinibacter ruber]